MPPAMASAPSSSGPVEAPVKMLTWNFWPRRLASEMRRAKRQRHRLGIAGAGEAAHAYLMTILDERGRFFGTHNAIGNAGVENAGSSWKLRRC